MTTAVAEERVIHIDTKDNKGKRTTVEVGIPEELQIYTKRPPKKKKIGVMRVITIKDGDRRIVWDPMSIAEINAARKMFNDLVKQGMKPYQVGTDGSASAKVMRKFDPHAAECIFLPLGMICGG